jgi:transcriptional regulator with XRE-family HTH domain
MTEQNAPTLAELLKRLREAAGLSLYELDKRTGINRSTLMRIEDGTTTQPDVDTLNRLARALGVDPEDFYDALWAHTAEPLPSPATYFRRKYALSDEQVAELEAAVERITNNEQENT